MGEDEHMMDLRCAQCVAETPNADGTLAEYLHEGTALCAKHMRERARQAQ